MGKFILKKQPSGIGFVFKRENEIILEGCQQYSSKDDCQNCLRSLFQSISPSSIEDCTIDSAQGSDDPKFAIFFDETDGYFFRVTSADGRLVARSGNYLTKLDCINAIDAIIKTVTPVI